jgi:glucokinase
MTTTSPLTVLGLDLGNTNLTVAVVTGAGQVLARWRRPNPRAQDAAAGLAVVEEMLRQALREHPQVAAVGAGFGGPVDVATGEIRRSHHTEGWEGLRLGEWIGERLGLPAFVDNDANAGGLAEALFGAGRGADAGSGAGSLLYVNVGTGIGGAVILGGRVHHGAHSNAGEIGHVVVTPEQGPRCTCGKRGCVEAWASGDALGAAARAALADPALPTALRALPPDEVTGRAVSEAAAQGDALAQEVLRRAGRYLGVALAAACNVLDPELVVLGGGVSEGNPLYLEAAQAALRAYGTPPVAAETRLVPAALGYEAGVIGAAAVALQALGGVK